MRRWAWAVAAMGAMGCVGRIEPARSDSYEVNAIELIPPSPVVQAIVARCHPEDEVTDGECYALDGGVMILESEAMAGGWRCAVRDDSTESVNVGAIAYCLRR